MSFICYDKLYFRILEIMYGIGVIILIETIYSNDNSDSNRTDKVQTPLKMPKNIRQVGKSNSSKKIYIEDYVMTYVKQLTGEEFTTLNVAVLVGQCDKTDNGRNIFISGAVKVEDVCTDSDIVFTNDVWTAIYDDVKKYFIELEIVGWFIGGPGYLLEEEDKILKTHINNFAGQDKILLTYDGMEKEEKFLCYENSRLNKQEGYYIYYEKNEEMQTYIIDHKTTQSIEEHYDDKVSRDIRATIQKHTEKKQEEDSKNVTRLIYAAGTLLAIVVLIVGAAVLRNLDQMKNIQTTLNTLKSNMQEVQQNITGDNTKNSDNKDTSKSSDDKSDNMKNITDKPSKPSDVTNKNGDKFVEIEPGNVNPIKDPKPTDKPIKNTPTPKPKSTPTPTPKLKYYIVKDGDTLADISYKLYKTYTKVTTIMKLNGITDQNHIKIGQKLIVP